MSNNGGVRGKFQERLRRIRLFNSKKRKQVNVEQEQFIKDKVQEIREVVGSEPRRPYRAPVGIFECDEFKRSKGEQNKEKVDGDSIKRDGSLGKDGLKKQTDGDKNLDNNGKEFVGREEKIQESENISQPVKSNLVEENSSRKDKLMVRKYPKSKLGYDELEEEREKKSNRDKIHQSNVFKTGKRRVNRGTVASEKEELIEELGRQILDKLKSSFEDKLDELEVLEGELFLINDKQVSEVELKKVQELKKRIDILIDQVNGIIEQYNLYKRNYYLDNVIGIDDNELVDEIIDYRTLLDSYQDEKEFVKEYKLLGEFQNFYQRLVNVREETIKLQQENEEKIEDFEVRDRKYQKITEQLFKVEDFDKSCSRELSRQNEYFKKLMEKVSKIDQEKYVTYHLRGMGDLIGQSLRYVGLLMLSPFSGMLPGITLQTLATRRLVGNIYRNMRIEEVQHVEYHAIDYDSELNMELNNIDYTAVLIDDTLKDVTRLKEQFMLQYDSRIPNYDSTLKKIDAISDKMVRNRHKVEIIRKNLKVSKKLNECKMVRVKELKENLKK